MLEKKEKKKKKKNTRKEIEMKAGYKAEGRSVMGGKRVSQLKDVGIRGGGADRVGGLG